MNAWKRRKGSLEKQKQENQGKKGRNSLTSSFNQGKRRLSFKVTLFGNDSERIFCRFASFGWRQKLRRRSELLSGASFYAGCHSSPSMSSGVTFAQTLTKTKKTNVWCHYCNKQTKSVIEYTKFGSQHLRLAWCNPCMEIGKN